MKNKIELEDLSTVKERVFKENPDVEKEYYKLQVIKRWNRLEPQLKKGVTIDDELYGELCWFDYAIAELQGEDNIKVQQNINGEILTKENNNV